MDERPSYLQVDRWNVASDPRAAPLRDDPEWAAHLSPLSDEVPAWVLALERPRRGRRWWWVPVLTAAVVLVGLGLRSDRYVGVKGAPTATVHLRSASGSVVWDGASPLEVGDEIRLELTGLESPFFAVVYASRDEPPVVLVTGSRSGLLDAAWVFDAPAAGGRLVVVGGPEDLDGHPVEELLARPPEIVVPLR